MNKSFKKKALGFEHFSTKTGQARKNLFTTRSVYGIEQRLFLLPKNPSAYLISLATLIGYRRAYTPAIARVTNPDDKPIRFQPINQLGYIRLYTANPASNLTQRQRFTSMD